MQTIRYHHNPVTGQAYYDPVDYTQALVEEMVEGRAIETALREVPAGAMIDQVRVGDITSVRCAHCAGIHPGVQCPSCDRPEPGVCSCSFATTTVATKACGCLTEQECRAKTYHHE
jgi:hypothetical protein